mgnify:CR=1 FL=1
MSEDNNQTENTENVENTENSKDYSVQEENWQLMVFCNMPWEEAAKIQGDDREFLLQKAEEGKLEVLKRKKEAAEQQLQQQQAQQAMIQQQQLAQQQAMMQQMPQQPNMNGNGMGMMPQQGMPMPQR